MQTDKPETKQNKREHNENISNNITKLKIFVRIERI